MKGLSMTYHIVFIGWLRVRHRLRVGWSGGVGTVDAADAGERNKQDGGGHHCNLQRQTNIDHAVIITGECSYILSPVPITLRLT